MKRKRILIVDDDQASQYACQRFLSKEHEVQSVPNSDEALALCKDAAFDMILLDIKMSGLSPLEFLKWVKANRPATPVLIMTGSGSLETFRNVMAGGADGFLDKPFGAETLGALVDKCFSNLNKS